MTPKDRQILFMDMNSYFASVEQQANPSLRGKPVGVTPVDAPSGCVIAASIEAKRLGVSVGDTVKEARLTCPTINIVISDPDKYLSLQKEIIAAFESLGRAVHGLSIDESYIELPEGISSAESFAMARELKERITAIGEWLRCSVGVAPNVFLAKTAAESMKPDGFVELTLDKLEGFFAGLPALEKITGIKRGMGGRLRRLGIYSPLEFFRASPQSLRTGLGLVGDYWYLRLHGYRIDEAEFGVKSIGHQHVLSPRFRATEEARKVARKLAERAARRLRRGGYWAGGGALSLQYMYGGYYRGAKRVARFNDSFTFWSCLSALFEQQPYLGRPILSISVTAFDLHATEREQFLFPEAERRKQAVEAIDKINDRYGDLVITPASVFGIKDAAPRRIPFGRVRY